MPDYESLLARYTAAGQGHVFKFYAELNPSQQQSLLQSLSEINVERANKIFKLTTSLPPPTANEIKPLPASSLDSLLHASVEKKAYWKQTGLEAIADNKVV